jgi:hypothetical protein
MAKRARFLPPAKRQESFRPAPVPPVVGRVVGGAVGFSQEQKMIIFDFQA